MATGISADQLRDVYLLLLSRLDELILDNKLKTDKSIWDVETERQDALETSL